MSVPIGTTPTFVLTFGQQSGVDLTQAINVYVTFESGLTSFTKTGEALALTERSVSVTLTQEETLPMLSTVNIQVNWTTPDGKRLASEVIRCDMSKQLLMAVIE